MTDKTRARTGTGRLFLLLTGVLLTSTVGHTAARLMAAQMALGQSSFAFELAALLAALLAAAYVMAFRCQRPRHRITADRDRSTEN